MDEVAKDGEVRVLKLKVSSSCVYRPLHTYNYKYMHILYFRNFVETYKIYMFFEVL
jgi:hypothetical protein